MTTVAVTGARGFLGGHLVDHLKEIGHEVVRLGRGVAGGPLVRLDGDAEALFDGVGAVVHLAGRLLDVPEPPLSAYLGPNVALTEEVLLGATAAGATRFVLASSRLVYPPDLGRPAREHDPVRPRTGYGLSKVFAEQTVTSYADRGVVSGVSLRISQVVGPGDGGRGVLARFIEAAGAGGPIEVTGEGVAVRDFVDVRDVVRAIGLAIVQDTASPVINVGGGGSSVRELAVAAATAAGLPPSAVRHVPTPDEDRSHWSLDTTLAREQLGWVPEWSLDQTVRSRLASAPG